MAIIIDVYAQKLKYESIWVMMEGWNSKQVREVGYLRWVTRGTEAKRRFA